MLRGCIFLLRLAEQFPFQFFLEGGRDWLFLLKYSKDKAKCHGTTVSISSYEGGIRRPFRRSRKDYLVLSVRPNLMMVE